MQNSVPFRLNRSGVLLALISAGFAGEAAAAAGRVDFTTSGVTVAGRDGQQRPLARGAELDSGDTIRTGAQGRAQIRFTDGSYVSLQPNTDFAISDYKYDGQTDGSERGFYGLVRGAMRTVTGAIGRVNRNAYRVTTPTATVGIRGTGGVIQVLNDGSTLVIGTSGIWSLTNPAGSIDVPAGVSGLAPTEPNTPPRETNTQPQSTTPPPVVQDPYKEGENVTPQGTADLGTVVKPLVSGPGYAFAIASSFFSVPHLDAGGNGTAVFDGAGQLTKLDMGGTNNFFALNGGTHAEFGTDGILAWGRWVGPVQLPAGFGECGTPCNENYNANQGLHYAIGTPTPVMPTQGIGNYTLMGATSPTYRDGSGAPGVFSGTLTMDFGGNRVSGQFNVDMRDGNTYSWGLSANPSGALFSQSNIPVTHGGGGVQCSSGCQAGVQGFFAGASAERAGMAYHIRDFMAPNKEILGAAAFKK
jgi:hypothetical protein